MKKEEIIHLVEVAEQSERILKQAGGQWLYNSPYKAGASKYGNITVIDTRFWQIEIDGVFDFLSYIKGNWYNSIDRTLSKFVKTEIDLSKMAIQNNQYTNIFASLFVTQSIIDIEKVMEGEIKYYRLELPLNAPTIRTLLYIESSNARAIIKPVSQWVPME